MGALYLIVSIGFAGVVKEVVSALFGDGTVSEYDYHFAPGVGAVFGSTKLF